MLNKNISILINYKLSQQNISVNEITEALKSTTSDIIGSIINNVQENVLDTTFRKKWNEYTNKMVL